MTATQVVLSQSALVDLLQSLVEAEQSSILQFIDEGSPWMNRASRPLRGLLADMKRTSQRGIAELSELIQDLDGLLRPPALQPEDQYLAYLSMKYLLPKAVQAEQQAVQRYESALTSARGAGERVLGTLRSLLEEHRSRLAAVKAAA